MARHPKLRQRRGQKHIEDSQESPFLNLPGEIRMIIYRAGLVRPTPIDLWPHKFIKCPYDDLSIALRIANARDKYPDQHRNYGTMKFRQQDDLQYVRKEMATGLLATCQQIRNESIDMFWSENTFRFSGDVEWFGVRRFLAGIGPGTLSLIRSLEVFAPVVESQCLDKSLFCGNDSERGFGYYRAIREAKNVPKMRMAKSGKEPGTPRVEFALTRNVEHVCYILREAKAFLDLRFILPQEFGLDLPQGQFWLRPLPKDNTPYLYIPEQLLQAGPHFAKSMTLTIEAGAFLKDYGIPEHFINRGIHMECLPGSFLKRKYDPTVFEFTELKQWKDRGSEYDYLVGLSVLFDESESFSVAARGGRVNKSAGKRKRVLKGFGGCKYLEKE